MNFKKLFPEKKDSQKRVLDFFDKKGFYIVLTLCIVIVGATAALITTKNISSSDSYEKDEFITDDIAGNISLEDESSAVSVPQDFGREDKTSTEAPKAISKATPAKQDSKLTSEPNKTTSGKEPAKTEEPAKSDNTTKKATTDNSENGNSAKNKSFSMPVFGEISFEYAQDKLLYSKTLDEWRSHAGVDLKASRGTPVKAVADGVVTEIKNDPRLGITIVVDHSNGIKTVYANLASGDMVSPNQKVKQGEVIGSVGNTAVFESAEPAHLHFEVLKNNKNVNPSDYLPNKAD